MIKLLQHGYNALRLTEDGLYIEDLATGKVDLIMGQTGQDIEMEVEKFIEDSRYDDDIPLPTPPVSPSMTFNPMGYQQPYGLYYAPLYNPGQQVPTFSFHHPNGYSCCLISGAMDHIPNPVKSMYFELVNGQIMSSLTNVRVQFWHKMFWNGIKTEYVKKLVDELGANPITVISYDNDCFALVLKRSNGHTALIVADDRSCKSSDETVINFMKTEIEEFIAREKEISVPIKTDEPFTPDSLETYLDYVITDRPADSKWSGQSDALMAKLLIGGFYPIDINDTTLYVEDSHNNNAIIALHWEGPVVELKEKVDQFIEEVASKKAQPKKSDS